MYLMSNNFDELVLIAGAMLLGMQLPLTALQIIWVNFVTGSIPAVAYAFDKERATPRALRGHAVLSKDVIVLTFGFGMLTSIALLFMYTLLVKSAQFETATINSFMFLCFSTYTLALAY